MYILFTLLISLSTPLQHAPLSDIITFQILDEETEEPLSHATIYIRELDRGTTVDEEGFAALADLSPGSYTFIFRHVGYETVSRTLYLPFTGDQPSKIVMDQEHEHLDEVTVSTTRTTRSIEDAPTRVEAITLEEIEEKANMRPGDIRMLLAESTGIDRKSTRLNSSHVATS